MPTYPSPRVRELPGDAGESSVSPVAIILLIGIALLAGANVYTLLQVRQLSDDVTARFDSHEERLALLDGNVARTSSALDSEIGAVKELVETTEEQLGAQTRQVEQRVIGETQSLQEKLEDARQVSEARISEVGGELAEVRETSEAKISEVGGRVETVNKELEATKAELEETIKELTSVKGDLGVQSGLIATNGDELAALKRLGERNYYEFNLGKTRKPQRVGPVSVKLTGTDRGKNRYSIELWADDNKIVKRRKTLLEPVQFYVEGARTPYELVVNKIDNGVIAGYLATPKGEGRRGS